MKPKIHVALDFDRTLHDYRGKENLWNLSRPLEPMLETVKKYLAAGEHTFTIFTARLSHEETNNEKQKVLIQDWLESHGLPRFEITATKFHYFDEFWDDKAVPVIKNVGTFKNQ